MTLAFDAQAFRDLTTGGTFTIVPVGTPRGIAVMVAQSGSTTDVITSVAYGGGTLTRINFGTTSTTESGATYLYFRGSSVAASGTVNVVAGSATFTAWAMTVTANPYQDTEVSTSGGTHGIQANPAASLTLAQGDVGLGVSVFFSGLADPLDATIAAKAGYTKLTGSATGGRDFGANAACAAYGPEVGPATTISWTSGSDDVTMLAGFIREVPPTVLAPFVFTPIERT